MNAQLAFTETPTVQRGDLFTLGRHRLLCGDSTSHEDVARLMQGEKASLVFADPPYGMAIDTWDKPLQDIPGFILLTSQQIKQGGFFAFTQQMPHMLSWLNALEVSPLKYRDHIAWIKRHLSAITQPLPRSHENLFIYALGNATYYQTKGRYEDVKLPGVLVDVITLEGIDRYIKDLQIKARGSNPAIKDKTANHHPAYRHMPMNSDRSPEMACFTNVWSFLPETQRYRRGNRIPHATAKPIKLIERLLILCTPEQASIYDPFLGSGTTLIAAENLHKRCVGMEISPEYCSVAIQRWQEMTCEKAVQL